VTLREMHIARTQSPQAAIVGSRVAGRNLEAELKKLDPTERDLLRLSEEERARPTTLALSGITTDTAALQRYLVALGKESLIIKAELTSLEANHNEQPGTWRFAARLEIRSGYGQAGGPESL
jgi:Tfp pilus assembly protein PilN